VGILADAEPDEFISREEYEALDEAGRVRYMVDGSLCRYLVLRQERSRSLRARIRRCGSDCRLAGVSFDIEVGADLSRCLRITKFDGGCAAA
jgi:hypothetical protein